MATHNPWDITPETTIQPGDPWHAHPHDHGWGEHAVEAVDDDHWHSHAVDDDHHDQAQHHPPGTPGPGRPGPEHRPTPGTDPAADDGSANFAYWPDPTAWTDPAL